MKTFTLYRRQPPVTHTSGGYANAPDEPQLEGVVFSDGTVCVRWVTDLRSHSLWDSFETFEKVHGHPEYDSEIVWHISHPKQIHDVHDDPIITAAIDASNEGR